jgi:hypothetical protein
MSSEGPRGTEYDHRSRDPATALDPDAEFGGSDARKKLEKRLLLKLDARMSILFVILYPQLRELYSADGYSTCIDTHSVQIDRNNAA